MADIMDQLWFNMEWNIGLAEHHQRCAEALDRKLHHVGLGHGLDMTSFAPIPPLPEHPQYTHHRNIPQPPANDQVEDMMENDDQ